ncbi:hydroxyacid dehydrogenase [soil metagenome]
MLNAAYVLDPGAFDLIYGPAERADIAKVVDVAGGPISGKDIAAHLEKLKDIEIIFSGWGGPVLDEKLLAGMPKLKAVFYGAGTIKGIVTDSFWQRNIPITSSYAANAVPVAEFTLAQILFSLKAGWNCIMHARLQRSFNHPKMAGAYGSTVGLVSLGMIGRRVAQLLQPFDVKVIAFDPIVTADAVRGLGIELVSLAQVFKESDVVSLHTPWLKVTENMIDGSLIASMKPNATLINTSRGAIINEVEMIEVLKERSDLWAVLDVTHPEPPGPASPLWELPNVILTPHIAGSIQGECRRMGRVVVDELNRFLRHEPLRFSISREQAAVMA